MRNTIGTLLADFRIRMTVLAILGGLACTSHAQNITTFDPPNSTYTIGTAINPRGQITGYFRDGRGNHGFLRQRNGTFITFDVVVDPRPGGFPPNAFPMDINAGGQITGFYEDETVIGSFLRQTDGTILKIPSPNTLLTSSTAMDQGVNQGPRPFCSEAEDEKVLGFSNLQTDAFGGFVSNPLPRRPWGVVISYQAIPMKERSWPEARPTGTCEVALMLRKASPTLATMVAPERTAARRGHLPQGCRVVPRSKSQHVRMSSTEGQ